MKKRMIACVLLTVVLLGFSGGMVAFAEDPTDWLKSGAVEGEAQKVVGNIENSGRSVHALISAIGKVAGIISIMLLGLKWKLAGSDATEKKLLKGQAGNLVTGFIIFFGAVGIFTILYSLANGLVGK